MNRAPSDPNEAPATAEQSLPGPLRRLRLLSYNIQAGSRTHRYSEYLTHSWKHMLPHRGKRENLNALAEVVGQYDLVGLQEADSGSLRSGFLNQTEYLAETAGFPYWSHQTNRRMAKLAESSNGLLSRFQPSQVIDHPLPGRIPGRGAMVAHFGPREAGLAVVIAHLSLGPRARRMQLDFISEVISDHRNVVVMGDFNCQPKAPEMQRFVERSGLLVPSHALNTFPSWRPQRDIDHILVSDGFTVETNEVLDLRLSDHRPIAMTLELPESLQMGVQ